MMRTFPAVNLFSATVLICCLAGCGKKNPDPSVTSAAQVQPIWSMQLSSACLSATPDECLAGYGFSISADAHYKIGPAPNGQLMTGVVASDDFSPLNKLLTGELLEGRSEDSGSNCGSYPNDSSKDKLFLSYLGNAREVLEVGSSELCSRGIAVSDGKDLYEALRKIARKYYHVPFPDGSCETALAALDSAYAAIQRCAVDSDCTYVNDSYGAVSDNALEFLVTGDCTAVKPLVVANRKLLEASQSSLISQRDFARDACKTRLTNPGCSGFSRFQATQPRAVCMNTVCHANSSLGVWEQ